MHILMMYVNTAHNNPDTTIALLESPNTEFGPYSPLCRRAIKGAEGSILRLKSIALKMAFYPIMRKASAHIAPLAFRAAGVSNFQICSIGASKIIKICRPNSNLESRQMNPLRFSTDSTIVVKKKKKQVLRLDDVNASDRNLTRILNSEIKCVVDSDLFTIVRVLYSKQINLYNTMDFTIVI